MNNFIKSIILILVIFVSYADTTNAQIRAGGPHFKITVDTMCAYWNICVYDSTFGQINHGIMQIDLMDDPTGELYGIHPGQVLANTSFDDSLDPSHTFSIQFSLADSEVCFKVLIDNGIDSAYAPIFIVDDQGAAVIFKLYYIPPPIKLSKDSGRYFGIMPEHDTCETFIFKNFGIAGTDSFAINSAMLTLNNPGYLLTTIPQLPVILKGGDSLIMTVCFKAKDTMTQIDTIKVSASCFIVPISLLGKASTPLIYATDCNFGTAIVGTSSCRDLTIFNKGSLPFTLTKNWLLHDTINFSMDSSSAAKLPVDIQPGKWATLTFCFSPHITGPKDSTTIDWNTNIEPPYTKQTKSWSFLKGTPIKPGLIWDRTTQYFEADSGIAFDSVIQRVQLINSGTAYIRNIKAFKGKIRPNIGLLTTH